MYDKVHMEMTKLLWKVRILERPKPNTLGVRLLGLGNALDAGILCILTMPINRLGCPFVLRSTRGLAGSENLNGVGSLKVMDLFFWRIHTCAPRGTEPHVALPCTNTHP
jgi:hypothetical protein